MNEWPLEAALSRERGVAVEWGVISGQGGEPGNIVCRNPRRNAMLLANEKWNHVKF
jgi:hypothetical protein